MDPPREKTTMELEILFEKYNKVLISFVYRMCQNRELAEDIVQETFLRAIINQELLYMMHEKQVRSWLYRVAKNLYVDSIRSHAADDGMVEIEEEIGKEDDHGEIEWSELFERLPGRQGVIMYLHYFEGYSSDDIGKTLDIPSGTVRYEMGMARKNLREIFKKNLMR